MSKTRTWVVLTAFVVLAVLAGGWFLLVSPKRAAAADLRTQAAAQRSSVAQLRVQLATLHAQEQGLPAQKDKLAAVLAKLPSAAAVPDLIRSLAAVSTTSGVELVSFTPGALAPLAAPAAVARTAPSAASTTASATAEPAVSAAAAPAGPTNGVQVLPLTIQVVGGYANLERYLNELESASRAVRVTGLSVAPGSSPVQRATAPGALDGSSLTVSVTAQAYVYTPPAGATTSRTGTAGTAAPATPAPGSATALAPVQ